MPEIEEPEQPEQNQAGPEKIVIGPNGGKFSVPIDATPQEVASAIGINLLPSAPVRSQYNFDPALNKTIDFIRPFISGAAGHFAGIGGSMIPMVGPVAGPAADVGAYTLTDQILKQLKPQQDEDAGIDSSFKDAIINMVTSKIINGVWKTGSAVRNAGMPDPRSLVNFKPTASQGLEAYGFHNLATAAKFAEDFGATGAKAAALDRAGGAGFTQALGFANALNGRTANINIDPVKLADKLRGTLNNMLVAGGPTQFKPASHYAAQEALDVLAGGQNPFAKIDTVLQDSDRLSKVLRAGQLAGPSGLNVRKDLQAYQFMRMINDATTEDLMGGKRIDPNKLANMWTDKDMKNTLDTLWGKQGRDNVSEFLKNIYATQDPMKSFPVAKQLSVLGAGYKIGLDLIKGDIIAAGSQAAKITGVYLPAAAMGRLLAREDVGKFMTQLAGNYGRTQGAPLMSRAIVSGLQGLNVALTDDKNNMTWGRFEKDPKSGSYQFTEFKK